MSKRLAMIGFGAMGKAVHEALSKKGDIKLGAILLRASSSSASPPLVKEFRSTEELVSWKPDLVVECAGHEAVRQDLQRFLSEGVSCIVSSIGALGDATLRENLISSANHGQAKLITVSGAIGGLDALRGMALASLDEVTYIGTKPPAAWKGSKAESLIDLADMKSAKVFFEGNAAQAAADFPKNANVTAATALAGIGFEKTKVKLIADPNAKANRHEVMASSPAGRFTITLENAALPSNPRTSWLAALSVEFEIRRYFSHFQS
jgi:aspartate dehydrogenase